MNWILTSPLFEIIIDYNLSKEGGGMDLKNAKTSIALLCICILPFIFTTISYAQTERWTYTFSDTGFWDDHANDLVYGSDGNIYIAGYSSIGYVLDNSFTVVSLTSSGTERWVYTYGDIAITTEAHAIVYGMDNNIYATGEGDSFAIISFTESGVERWIYNNPGKFNAIEYGLDDNIYVVGDPPVVSLTSSGTERWVFPSESLDVLLEDVVYGSDNNIYAAGCSLGVSYKPAVISFTPSGTKRWEYYYNDSIGGGYDVAHAIVYGLDGNIYIAGRTTQEPGFHNFLVISLTSSGTERWVYTYNGPGNRDDRAWSLDFGADGNIYVTGNSSIDIFELNITVISLTSSGTERWVYIYDDANSTTDDAYDIIYGADGNIYVAGRFPLNWHWNFGILSLTPSGTERWVYTYEGSMPSNNTANAIVYGADGHIYAAGDCRNVDTNHDFIVVSLDPSTGIEEHSSFHNLPNDLYITPNPFHEKINIEWHSASNHAVSIDIYDVIGQSVNHFNHRSAHNRIVWDGRDSSGNKVSSGVYFLKFKAGDYSTTEKLLLLR